MLTAATIYFLVLLSPASCGQEQPPATAKNIKITVVVILASEEGTFVDKRLPAIAAEVRKRNENLKSFKLESMTCASVKVGEKRSFKLVEDQKAEIVLKHGADPHDRVGLAITPPLGAEIEYRTVCGKFLPIVTRYQTRRNERLIIAVRVQPCNGQ